MIIANNWFKSTTWQIWKKALPKRLKAILMIILTQQVMLK
jgi:hypothetical protein